MKSKLDKMYKCRKHKCYKKYNGDSEWICPKCREEYRSDPVYRAFVNDNIIEYEDKKLIVPTDKKTWKKFIKPFGRKGYL